MNYEMSPECFMKKVVQLYHKAREPKFPAKGGNVFRGRSASISSALEDLFAHFLAENSQGQHTFYVDQCMRFGKGSRYPDVVVKKDDDTISDLFDLKADVGWKRNGMYGFCEEWNNIIEQAQETETKFNLGTTKEQKTARFSLDLKYHVVVITDRNASKKLDEDVARVNQNLRNVRMYVLSRGIHPNEYIRNGKFLSKGAVFNELRKNIDRDAFDQLLETVQ